MTNYTPELVAKAKAAKSAEELFALAKEIGMEITEEEAKTYFSQLNANGVVSDDELDAVAGGGSCPGDDEEEKEESSSDCSGITGRCFNCHGTEIIFQMYSGDKIYRCKKCSTLILETYTDKDIEII
jgi:predicted ribosomally synthesized peptide with nif11-like leader